jgi:hypothetical protein
MSRFLLSLILAAAAIPALAQEPAPSTVEVNAVRDPEVKSYRHLLAALDAFDKHHALAPQAGLRFQLKDERKADGLVVQIAGQGAPVELPVAADGTFAVPRIERLADEDAELVLNRKKKSLSLWPRVRTPGIPEGVIRLGDLRLECRVAIELGKKELGFMASAMISTLALGGDWCAVDSKRFSFWTPTRLILDGATVREGARSEALAVRGRSILAPLADKRWSDEALIELKAVPPGADLTFVLGTMNRWRVGDRLREQEPGVLQAEVWFGKGEQQFVIGAEGDVPNAWGAAEDAPLAVGQPVALAQKGARLRIDVKENGYYLVSMDRRGPAPTLTLTRIAAAGKGARVTLRAD